MNQRPRSVTVIAALFLMAGVVGVAYHATELKTPFERDVLWVLVVRLLAIIGAVFLFRGQNWARWLLLIWMAYHVGLSSFHSLPELIMHGLLLAVIAYFLFRRRASIYFRSGGENPVRSL